MTHISNGNVDEHNVVLTANSFKIRVCVGGGGSAILMCPLSHSVAVRGNCDLNSDAFN